MAGFNTAITGLKSASTDLDVTGNNIANSSTVGFKSSRTEFADIYASAVVGAGSSNIAGSGVTVSDIAQDFGAGTIEFTNNNLDLAINGSGFFQLDNGQGSVTYTRAGAFELDKEGNIVSKDGKNLQGYGVDDQGNLLPVGNLAVNQKESPPKPTENIDLSFNIDAATVVPTLAYDPDEPSSYSYSTTVPVFDSLGNQQTIKFNLVEQSEGSGLYDMYAYLNGDPDQPLDIGGSPIDPADPESGAIVVAFDTTNGLLSTIGGTATSKLTIAGADSANAATTIDLDLAGTTQFASTSIVKTQQQDGYTKGDLIGVSFGSNGEMIASFSNGQNQQLGVVAIATFENQAGLGPSGGTEWTATLDSGSAIINPPGSGLSGSLRSAALEQSNVDLSAELVSLIEAQRNFQANSKTLETLNTVTQTILQI
uniref:flagellar hook protein FlgE n=1 Tax=Marinobacterium profundum TaxID=1714300 RepID=UPI00082D2487|nr:flagellar hook protein FlgE [Marinobacterium profundum]